MTTRVTGWIDEQAVPTCECVDRWTLGDWHLELCGDCKKPLLFFILSDSAPALSRVTLSRKKGWRMPSNTVKVDRTTKWGNPFVPGKPAPIGPNVIVADKRHAFLLYRSIAPFNDALITAARAELRGKNLACWCAPNDPGEDACHAAVLLAIANA